MFIIGIIVLWILAANSVAIPSIAMWIVGVIAALEALLYLVIIAINLFTFNKIRKDF